MEYIPEAELIVANHTVRQRLKTFVKLFYFTFTRNLI